MAVFSADMADIPYEITRVLSSPASKDLVYVFLASSGPAKDQLLAVNASRTLDNADLPYSTISPSLPFLEESSSTYIPVIDGKGSIIVYAGNCRDGAQGSKLWRLDNPEAHLDRNASWSVTKPSDSGLGEDMLLGGANYLASGLAFSPTEDATAELYIFGGMCPNMTTLATDNWTQSATYSNKMLSIHSVPSSASFELGFTPSRGPPIAEAGFTVTPLDPTFSISSGNQSQSQNQNYVLIGGHTQTAFINMSQVALFSLPEESWTFLPIDRPATIPSTDLAVRESSGIDSRSGHTALLTSDGKRVIVFGGWVGDISQPADPQLAVLELGQGYGGSGDWQWSIPSQTGPGLAAGAGIYGHGATILEGDVMMIVGGYDIPASTGTTQQKRSPAASTRTYFFNTTSNSWITSYARPLSDTNGSNTRHLDNSAARTAKRAGLGAGLTLGILAIIIAVITYFWYSRRLKRRRDAREEELRKLAAGAHGFHLSDGRQNEHYPSMSEMETAVRTDSAWPLRETTAVLNRNARGEPEAERTGLLFEIPSPTRGLRRSLHSRGSYQPASRYDNGRRTPTIHRIDEREEDDEAAGNGISTADNEMIQKADFDLLSNVPVLDPFRDSADRSRSPSPQSPMERKLEIQRWVNDWTAADALMQQHAGRLSPEKTDRTSSTLSDQSARSMLSSSSIQHSIATVSRTLSQRSAALLSATPFRSANDTAPMDQQPVPSSLRNGRDYPRSQSLTLFPGAQQSITMPDTSATAATSFHTLEPEGEGLLGNHWGEPSPIRSRGRAKGWMGSFRRAFTGDRSVSTSPEHGDSASSAPIKHIYTDSGLPRRAASTGAMLWKKRQGAKDWDVESVSPTAKVRKKGEDEEWDIESAVERRVVQVMFTVPKEKLRVVNKNPDGDGESMLSAEVKDVADGGEKGKGKESG
ncbi:MAG: hypothetical protein Q9163_005320 [Psora crenata]